MTMGVSDVKQNQYSDRNSIDKQTVTMKNRTIRLVFKKIYIYN